VLNRLMILFLFCTFVAGCSSKLVRMPGSKASSEYAPVNEKS